MINVEVNKNIVYEVYNKHFKKFFSIKEDLVQYAFCVILDKLDKFSSDRGAESTFVYSVARNAMRDYVRKNNAVNSRSVYIEEVVYNVEEDYAEKEDKKVAFGIAKEIFATYPQKKKLIVSDYMNGYKYNEIAERRDVSHQYAQKVVDGFFDDCKKFSETSCVFSA